MKNTILDFDYEEIELTDEWTADVSDYFSKDISIWDLWENVQDYIQTYKIQNNDKLERISYELYGTTDYWDILALLNQRDPLFQMPYDYTTLYENASNYLNQYIYYIYSHAPLNDTERIQELLDEFINDFDEVNETNRYIYIIKPSKIGEFIKLLKDNSYL